MFPASVRGEHLGGAKAKRWRGRFRRHRRWPFHNQAVENPLLRNRIAVGAERSQVTFDLEWFIGIPAAAEVATLNQGERDELGSLARHDRQPV